MSLKNGVNFERFSYNVAGSMGNVGTVESIRCLFVDCGEFSYRIEKVSISGAALEKYERYADSAKWIRSEKVRLYIVVTMIKYKMTLYEALNKYISKKYVKDPIYRDLFLGDWSRMTHEANCMDLCEIY